MNLFEFEGKELFKKNGLKTPKGLLIKKNEVNLEKIKEFFDEGSVVLKVQILSGKRGKNNGIIFSEMSEIGENLEKLFNTIVNGYKVEKILIEEKQDILEEKYVSFLYDTSVRGLILIYSKVGGMDIENVDEEKIKKVKISFEEGIKEEYREFLGSDFETVQKLYEVFLKNDCQTLEVNPLVKAKSGDIILLDAKICLDDDAFFRHEEWKNYEPRTLLKRELTEREIEAKKVDEGENYYRGTASKYIEMDGDVGVLFSGGGASIMGMDSLIKNGLKPANYTEYSGNPPKEKVETITRIVLSKPNLRGLAIMGGVANFTDIKETFSGIISVLDELKPKYPIVIRRSGPNEEEAKELTLECAKRNSLNLEFFGKETSIDDAILKLKEMICG